MPLKRLSGTVLALSYAFSCGFITLLLARYAMALATPLLITAGGLLLVGSFMVDLPQSRHKANAFKAISSGCLILCAFLGGHTALLLQEQGFGMVSFLHALVVVFMAYLTGLAFESRHIWFEKSLTQKG